MKKKKQASVENVMEILVETFKPQDGYILCLKSLPANLKAYEGFQWPEVGPISAPDWKPTQECGNGLHAFKWGVGDVGLACMEEGAKWLVLNVKEEGIVDLDGKIKFEQCEVVYCGARDIAISIIEAHAPAGTAVMFGTATAGDSGTATAGYKGTATAGEWGILVIEYYHEESMSYRKKCAVVDSVSFLPGVKYCLKDGEFVTVNETEA